MTTAWRNAKRHRALALLAGLTLGLGGCAATPDGQPNRDPLEPVNRVTYKFNDTVDTWVLRPTARGYKKITPALVRKGVGNFFNNLGEPLTMVNDLLQLKPLAFVHDTTRFVVNSTFGVAGLFEVAEPLGLPRNDEDFGQTLGYWGVGPGWYVVLPFLGPSTTRDTVGVAADWYADPLTHVEDDEWRWGLRGLNIVDTRARLLPTDRLVEQAIDPYVFVREAYLQRRRSKVHDGEPPQRDDAGYVPPPPPGRREPPPPPDRNGSGATGASPAGS